MQHILYGIVIDSIAGYNKIIWMLWRMFFIFEWYENAANSDSK